MIKKEIKATIHVACTYLKLEHHKIVSRYCPCNTNKKSRVFPGSAVTTNMLRAHIHGRVCMDTAVHGYSLQVCRWRGVRFHILS